jgi:hypothetical protein
MACAKLTRRQYLAISPYNKEHYFVAFRDRTIKYNFIGAPPEWMQQMQEVFSQWQAEIAQQFVPPGVTPYAPQPQLQPQPQQWNTLPAQPSPHSGYTSPQLLPNSPMSTYSTPHSPPVVFAHHASAPQFAPVEMMGSLPPGAPMGGMLAAPPPQPPVQAASEVCHSFPRLARFILTIFVEEEKISFKDIQLIVTTRLLPLSNFAS